MVKKKRVVLGVVLILIVLLGGLTYYNIISFPYKENVLNYYSKIFSQVSEFLSVAYSYVLDLVAKLPWEINVDLVKYIIGGVVILVLFLISFRKFVKMRNNKKKFVVSRKIIHKKSKSETDLDVLYDLLKKKKSLNIDAISNMFKLKKEKALEWAKILENHKLVAIEYPAFSVPVVRVNEKAIAHKSSEVRNKGEAIAHKSSEVRNKGEAIAHKSRDVQNRGGAIKHKPSEVQNRGGVIKHKPSEVVEKKNENKKEARKEHVKKTGKKELEKDKEVQKEFRKHKRTKKRR